MSQPRPPALRAAEIGTAFSTHYYDKFDNNRVELQHLYQDTSLLTFEKEQFMGMQSIMTKLVVRPRPSLHLLRRPALQIVARARKAF